MKYLMFAPFSVLLSMMVLSGQAAGAEENWHRDIDEALAQASKEDKLVFMDVYADWCGPCRMMAPEFSKAALTMQGAARFAKINTEDHQKVSAAFGIRGIPLLILFDKHREAARLPGARPAAEIESCVRSKSGAPA